VRIDINADVGEWTGDDPARATDAALLPLVTSVNVACGAHAGDEQSVAVTVDLATELGLAIGAHPGYPDREGFGRRPLAMTPDALRSTLAEQLARLAEACSARGATLGHVKAHGALYNAAARDPELARIVADAVRDIDERLALFGPPGSALLEAARDAGLCGVPEGFADRSYEPDGSLRPRSVEGAVLAHPELVASQAIHLAMDHSVAAVDGTWIAVPAETICLHGDTPNVVASARAVREALDSVGADVRRYDAL
jgi:5-oxoprolinase (ATP-hydrolysing) subunit A